MKKILLISGGYDSLLISEMKENIIDDYIYFNYENKFIEQETLVLAGWENHSRRVIKVLDLPTLKEHDGFFEGRNLEFMLAVRKRYPAENIVVYFGNNADDNYPDNSREYLYRLEKLLNDSFSPSVIRIITPLQDLTKPEIVRRYMGTNLFKEGIIPYFCDSGEEFPCGKCHSCLAMKGYGELYNG